MFLWNDSCSKNKNKNEIQIISRKQVALKKHQQ
jgi:hypothetical protein